MGFVNGDNLRDQGLLDKQSYYYYVFYSKFGWVECLLFNLIEYRVLKSICFFKICFFRKGLYEDICWVICEYFVFQYINSC